ncbi:unnamed protein product [Vitrella brassicaformis CCMP3155]|uniref:CCDC113/CCDC96 coiled-coil domain-containing protein n=1 Tax=Vitrella brassicaformis (strain CCMP3155) TaxID=1169540 RepID=A0A0G4F6J0_VITBC|nr:unnamed protein product [Vitrella brassicaformis CCMP3155]|eukprot:CEM07866.1 unnamed protein product [Vitrella brassicaformis CCMP3155]
MTWEPGSHIAEHTAFARYVNPEDPASEKWGQIFSLVQEDDVEALEDMLRSYVQAQEIDGLKEGQPLEVEIFGYQSMLAHASQFSLAITRFLVETLGNNVNIRSSGVKDQTPLFNSRGDSIAYLLERGADQYAFNTDGDCPMTSALRRGDYEQALDFLKQGLDVGAKDRHGDTGLFLACVHEAEVGMENAQDSFWEEFFYQCEDRPQEMRRIINTKCRNGNTCLHILVKKERGELIRRMLEWGANPEIHNDEGDTPHLKAEWTEGLILRAEAGKEAAAAAAAGHAEIKIDTILEEEDLAVEDEDALAALQKAKEAQEDEESAKALIAEQELAAQAAAEAEAAAAAAAAAAAEAPPVEGVEFVTVAEGEEAAVEGEGVPEGVEGEAVEGEGAEVPAAAEGEAAEAPEGEEAAEGEEFRPPPAEVPEFEAAAPLPPPLAGPIPTPGFPKAETEAEESAEEGEEQLSAVGEELVPEDTEEIMRQREEQRLLDEHEELTNLLVDFEQQQNELQKDNAELQRKVALWRHKFGSQAGGMEQPHVMANTATRVTEAKYTNVLHHVHGVRLKLRQIQVRAARMSEELKNKLEEKRQKAIECRDAFREFKRQVAKNAEYSRTGKPIPPKVLQVLEDFEKEKDDEVEEVRGANISLKNRLSRLEQQLRKKDELAENLHIIDFEQLKIENQTLNEKIEERNEELHKLRKKTVSTVQVTTHMREKLQFLHYEVDTLRQELSQLESELSSQRDLVAKTKHERDDYRLENVKLRQQTGIVNSDLLTRDFDDRQQAIKTAQQEIKRMRDRHKKLTNYIVSGTQKMGRLAATLPAQPGTLGGKRGALGLQMAAGRGGLMATAAQGGRLGGVGGFSGSGGMAQ